MGPAEPFHIPEPTRAEIDRLLNGDPGAREPQSEPPAPDRSEHR